MLISRIELYDDAMSERLERLYQEIPISIWNFGIDEESWQKLKGNIKFEVSFKEVDILDQAADIIADDLLNVDQQLGLSPEADLFWLSSLSADRNPYATRFQENCAKLHAINQLTKGDVIHVFVFGDVNDATCVFKAALCNNIPVSAEFTEAKPLSIWRIVRARLSAIKMHWIEAHYMKVERNKHRRDFWQEIAECDVLLFDWVGTNSFLPSQQVSHLGNMERLVDILRSQGLKVGFIAHPLSWVQNFKDIAKTIASARDPVVCLCELRSLWKAVEASWKSWRFHGLLKKPLFIDRLNVTDIWKTVLDMDLRRPQSTLFSTYSEIGRTLAKKGVKPKTIVYPFENQGWERAFIFGMRKALPETRIVGYQHAPFAKRSLGFFPSKLASQVSNRADKIILMGQGYLDWFKQYGALAQDYVIGGSLRFEKLHNKPALVKVAVHKKVLCAAPMDFADAVDIVMKSAMAIKPLNGVVLLINFHPIVEKEFRDNIRDVVDLVFEGDTKRFELSDKSAADLFEKSDVLLYNSSGTSFDATVVGMPTIYVAHSGAINFDKMPDQLSKRAFSISQLREYLSQALKGEMDWTPNPTISGYAEYVNEGAIVRAIIND